MLATETNPGSSYAAAHGFTKWTFAARAVVRHLAFLCGFTWLSWGALPVDCGREMYVPLQSIRKGSILISGTLVRSLVPYWHAVLFRVFGTYLFFIRSVLRWLG